MSRCSGKLQDIEANVGNIGTALKEIAEGTVEQTEDLRYFAENGRAVGRGNKSFGKELTDIRSEVGSIEEVSKELEKEMKKFKI